VAIAIAPAVLTFRREVEQYRGDYRVTLTLRRGDATVARIDATETVRLATVREAGSPDESLIFQQLLTLPPGTYSLTVAIADLGSDKKGSVDAPMRVPSLTVGSLAPPVPLYDVQPRLSRDSLPRVVANPRALAIYGRDTTLDLYLEAYAPLSDSRISLAVLVDGNSVWTNSLEMRATDSGVLSAIAQVPVVRVGPGAASVVATITGSTDTVRTPIFIGLGSEVPSTTFADVLSYLRYFGAESRIRTLTDATPATRALQWANFFRETDPNPATPENEALNDYLQRIRHTNATFGEGATPGWRTDRGMVYLLLGSYDQVVDPFATDPSQRGRVIIWEYRSLNLSVEFVRANSLNQWKLTAESEAAVRAAARRLSSSERE
jgi:GWxTD domain-containing protein